MDFGVSPKTILQQAKVLFTILVFIDVHEEII